MSTKEETPKLCGAKLRKKDATCRQRPMKGRKKCRLHGGASLSGIASPTFKHGRYSKVLPTGLRKKFEDAGRDPFLLSHEPELKLLDVKLSELIGELGQDGGSGAFPELQKAWKELQSATLAGDESRVATCKSTLDGIFQRGMSDTGIWRQILDCIEARRKILESESKRLKEQGQSMSVEQLLAIIEYIVDVIRESVLKYADRVTGQQILAKVTADLRTMVSKSDPSSGRTTRCLS